MTFNKKHCLLFLLLFLTLLGITAISATNTDTINTQEIIEEDLSTPTNNYDVDKMVQSSVNTKGLESNVKNTTNSDKDKTKTINKNIKTITKQDTEPVTVNNYNELKTLLTTTTDEELTVELSGQDTTYTANGVIDVNAEIKRLTINGNNYKITGSDTSQFLYLKNINLTLNDLSLTNFLAEAGSVINSRSSNILIHNSNFTNNRVRNGLIVGGVIYQEEYSNLTICNSVFTYNQALNGGVIYQDDNCNLSITNSIFNENNVTHRGGVFYQGKNSLLSVNNSNFTSNKATGEGAVIYQEDNSLISISNSNVTLNEANLKDGTGGIIYQNENSEILVNSSLFEENNAQAGVFYQESKGNIILNYSNFTHNTVDSDGGVVMQENLDNEDGNGNNLTILYSIFTENKAGSAGGAISQDCYSNMNISHSLFSGNIAEYYFGGAVTQCRNSNLSIENTTFKKNRAEYDSGGAIYQEEYNNLLVNNSEFIDNYADYDGGAIYNSFSTNIIVNNSKFKSNIAAEYGGAISFDFNLTVNNCTFTENQATEYGGAICDYNEFRDSDITSVFTGYLTLNNTSFNNNSANRGGALFEYIENSEGETAGNINNITFCEFNENRAEVTGGVLYLYNAFDTSIDNCNFTKNTAENAGIIITDAYGNLILKNSNCTANKATQDSAIIWIKEDAGIVTIENNTFNSNSVEGDDGWVFTLKEDTKINNNTFTNNTDNTRDMLFNILAKEVTNNIYIDNYLNDTLNISDETISSDYEKEVQLILRNVYNDTIRNGTLHIYINDDTSKNGTFTVTDGKANIKVNLDDLTQKENKITAKYITQSKHYQNMTTIFKLTVESKNTTITVKTGENVEIGDNVTITGKVVLKDDESVPVTGEKVKIYINNTYQDTVLTDSVTGEYSFNYTTDTLGLQNVTVELEETSVYYSSTNKTTFTVTKIPTTTKISIINSTIGDVVVNIKVTDDDQPVTMGHVIITDKSTGGILGEDDLLNGEINITLNVDKTGPLQVNATYQENDKYETSNDTTSITVKKLESTTTMYIADNTLTIGDSVLVYGTVTDSIDRIVPSGTVTVNINGTEYTTRIVDGEYKYENITTTSGTFNVMATFTGNDNISASNSSNKEYTVNKKPTVTTFTVKDTRIGNVNIDAIVVDSYNNPVTKGTLHVTLPSGSYDVRVSGAKTNIKINTTSTGKLVITLEYLENNEYKNSKREEEITVTKQDTTITVKCNTPVKVGEPSIISGVLTDEDNNPINAAKIWVSVDGNIVANVTTGNDGKYNATVNDTIVGTHNVEANYNGDNRYVGSRASTSLNVEKIGTSITINKVPDVAYGEIVTVTGKLTDENNNPISSAQVKVRFDGTTLTVNTDKNGNYQTSYQTSSVGTKEISAEYLGNNKYEGSTLESTTKVVKENATITLILPEDAKVGQPATIKGNINDKNGKNVAYMPVEVTVNGKTVKTVTDKDGNFEVETTNTVEGNNPVTIKSGNDYYNIKDVTDKFNATRMGAQLTINPLPDVKVGANVNITGKLVDEKTNPIIYAPLKVTVNNQTYPVITDDNGEYKLIYTCQEDGNNNVTVISLDEDYNTNTVNTTFRTSKVNVTVTVYEIKGTLGEDIILKANLTDEYGNPVSGGNLVFKMNGRTLRIDGKFNTNNTTPLKIKVEDGIVIFTIKADMYIRDAKNLTASYSGSYMYSEAKANIVSVNIRKRSASVSVSISPNNTRQNSDIVFSAKLRDVTQNARNTTCLTEDGNLIFKINGVTIKNSDGSKKLIPVTDSVVNMVYHVPTGMGGVDSNGSRDYVVEAVYDNPLFYPDTRNSSIFNVQRSKVNINFIKTSVKGNVLSVKANFTDFDDKYLVGTSKVCVKINGKTYQENGKTKYFQVRDGKVDLTGIKLSAGTTVKEVMLVTGAREGYLGARATTTDIITA